MTQPMSDPVSYYEGADFILVNDRSGEQIVLDALPAFPPKGQHFVVLVDEDGPSSAMIQVWGRQENNYALVWSGAPFKGLSTYYDLLAWKSEDAAMIAILDHQTTFSPPQSFVLQQAKNQWTVSR